MKVDKRGEYTRWRKEPRPTSAAHKWYRLYWLDGTLCHVRFLPAPHGRVMMLIRGQRCGAMSTACVRTWMDPRNDEAMGAAIRLASRSHRRRTMMENL